MAFYKIANKRSEDTNSNSQKKPSQKKAGGVAQVVEYPPSKGENLSLNPSTAIK
jgi:hypothetical protein